MGKIIWNRPRYHQLRGRDHGRQGAEGHPNEEGSRLTPSVVAFDDKGEVLVGQIARRQAITNPENTVFSSSDSWVASSPTPVIQDELRRVPYKISSASNGDVSFEIRGKRYSPPEIGARVLMKLKRAAEEISASR